MPDCAAMIFALAIIVLITVGMTMLAVLFMQWMLDIGQFFRRGLVTRDEKLVADDAANFIPARELAGD
jgi:hypothetical protein